MVTLTTDRKSDQHVVILCSSCRLPFWKLLTNVDSGQKVERELRTFSNRLRRHQLGEGVISLSEHSTNLLSDMVRAHCCTVPIIKCKVQSVVLNLKFPYTTQYTCT